MLPRAHLAHHVPGRTRLVVPSRKRDVGYFETLERELRGRQGIRAVEVRPVTGSIIIEHDDEIQDLASLGADREVFYLTLVPLEPIAPPGDKVWAWLDGINHKLRRFSRGEEDLASLAFLMLAGLGVFQAFRGSALPAATTLFQSALEVLERRHRRLEREGSLSH